MNKKEPKKTILNQKKSKSHQKNSDLALFYLKKTENYIKKTTPTEKSVVITLIILFLIVFSATLVGLSEKEKEILLEINAFIDESEKENSQMQLTENQIVSDKNISINAYNEADKTLKHTDEPFKSLDEILAERDKKELEQEKKTETEEISSELAQNTKKEPEKLEIIEKNIINKNSLVRYWLTDRKSNGDLPNPVFTCEDEGEVVVNIKVSEDGKVIHCSIDTEKSTTTNGCLIENALKYAQKARFNIAQGRGVQKGTITYLFQQK